MRCAWVVTAALAAGCGSGGAQPAATAKPAPTTAKAAPAPVDAAPAPVDATPAPVEDPCGAVAALWTQRYWWDVDMSGVVAPLEIDRVEPLLRRECESWPPETQQCAAREEMRAFKTCTTSEQGHRVTVRTNNLRIDPIELAKSIPAGQPCGYEALLATATACEAIRSDLRDYLAKRWATSASNPATDGGKTAVGMMSCKLATERLRIRLARVGC
jgi:hypothetical protein